MFGITEETKNRKISMKLITAEFITTNRPEYMSDTLLRNRIVVR